MKNLFPPSKGLKRADRFGSAFRLIMLIVIACLITAFLQAGSFFYASHYQKVLFLTLIFFIYFG